MLIGHHIAFIKADKDSPVITAWFEGIQKRLFFYQKYYQSPQILHQLLLALKYPYTYKKISRSLESWNFLGNGILNKILKKTKSSNEFLSLDRTNGTFPELTKYEKISSDSYQKFYFENNFSNEALTNTPGIILLHNSWTPDLYLKMNEQEFLKQNNTLAHILTSILGIKKHT